MRERLGDGLAIAMAMILAAPAAAQTTIRELTPQVDTEDNVFLTADSITYNYETETAEAKGGAVIYYGPRALSAEEMRYDNAIGAVSASGGVTFFNNDGFLLTADQATLSEGFESGEIDRPSLFMPEGARVTAVEGRRVDGRYSALTKAVYSPCEVCIDNTFPLWQIRARRILHDEEKRRVYYQGAYFDVYGQPIAYLPYFYHADPTVTRQTGFLAPKFSFSETLGATARTPYFINLSPDRDMTLTPFVTTKDGLIMEGEYRALTDTGRYEILGSLTYNSRTGEDRLRGHLDAEGRFSPAPFKEWGFDLNLATDDTYLARYEYSDADRVTSRLYAQHLEPRLLAQANTYYFQSFREDEPIDTIPVVFPELRFRAQALESPDYGVATLTASTLGLYRRGGLNRGRGAANPATGRDVLRASAGAEWERPFTFDFGLRATPFAVARANGYYVRSDATAANPERVVGRIDAAAGIDARYPFIRQTDVDQHIIEPIVQAVAAPNDGDQPNIPNEDSLEFEFDETNIFAAGRRFPGLDRFEAGPHVNVGARYEYQHDDGFGLEAAYGRVFRLENAVAFSANSGLREVASDHITMLRLKLPPYFEVTHRMRIDDETGDAQRQEVYASGEYGPLKASGSYVSLAADPANGVLNDRTELNLASELRMNDYWTLYGAARRDLEQSRFVNAGGGLRYMDECFEVDLSVTRRFNDRDDAEKGTDFGLIVRLRNLGF